MVTPKYLLTISLSTNATPSYTTASGTSGRIMISLNATYSLKDINSDELVSANGVNAIDNNNITDARFANYISEEVIEVNLTKIIAQNIRNLIINDLVSERKKLDIDE